MRHAMSAILLTTVLLVAGPAAGAEECTTGSSSSSKDVARAPLPTNEAAYAYVGADAQQGSFYVGYRTATPAYYYEVGRYPNGAVAAQVNIVPVGFYVGTDRQCTR